MAESGSKRAMDHAAEQAERELIANFTKWNAAEVSRWWNKWQTRAGDERLGRVLREQHEQWPIPNTLEAHLASDLAAYAEPARTKTKAHQRARLLLHQVGQAKTLVRRAERTVLHDLRSGLVKDEEAVTERLIGAIHQQFNDRVHAEIRWSAMTLTAHKRNAQETTFGADLLGVLRVHLKDYSIQKGFLAQAKLLRGSETLKPSEFNRLKQQCEKMLVHSNASYVFLYETEGVSVLPAVTVVSVANSEKLPALKRYSLVHFFEQHFNCFVGDQELHSPSDDTLERLAKKVAARDVLLLAGTSIE